MPVEKSICEKYTISNNGEYATICLAEHAPFEVPGGTRKTYGGELLVHSSFGDFAYTWTSCGTPFKEFLTRLQFNYLMQKLMGLDFTVYCPERTLASIQSRLDALEADGKLTPEEAVLLRKAILEEVAPDMDTGDAFMARIEEVDSGESMSDNQRYLFAEAYEYIGTKANPQAVGFWNELWPQFRDALKTELKPEVAAELAAA